MPQRSCTLTTDRMRYFLSRRFGVDACPNRLWVKSQALFRFFGNISRVSYFRACEGTDIAPRTICYVAEALGISAQRLMSKDPIPAPDAFSELSSLSNIKNSGSMNRILEGYLDILRLNQGMHLPLDLLWEMEEHLDKALQSNPSLPDTSGSLLGQIHLLLGTQPQSYPVNGSASHWHALNLLTKAIRLSSPEDKLLLARIYHQMALVYYCLRMPQPSDKYLNWAYSIYSDMHELELMAGANTDLARLDSILKENQRAKQHAEQALRLADRTASFNRHLTGSFALALSQLLKKKIDEAIIVLDKVYDHPNRNCFTPPFWIYLRDVHYALGLGLAGEYHHAETALNRAIVIGKTHRVENWVSTANLFKANISDRRANLALSNYCLKGSRFQ